MTERRQFSAEFKARVALEGLRGDKAIQEIASKHKVHPNQLSTWKRQAFEGAHRIDFEPLVLKDARHRLLLKGLRGTYRAPRYYRTVIPRAYRRRKFPERYRSNTG